MPKKAKKNIVKGSRTTTTTNTCAHCSGHRSWATLSGIILLLFGLFLWTGWLTIERVFAYLFILMGIKVLVISSKHC